MFHHCLETMKGAGREVGKGENVENGTVGERETHKGESYAAARTSVVEGK